MSLRIWITAILVLGLPAPLCGRAAEVRYYQQNGVTFSETRPVVTAPVPATPPAAVATSSGQGARPTCVPVRCVWTPVTNYAWEGYWVGRWNPFVEPYLVYRPVAVTHWELKPQTIQQPANTGGTVAQKPSVPAAVVPRPAVQMPAVPTPATQTVTVPTSPPTFQTAPVQAARPATASVRPSGPGSAPVSVAQRSPWGGIHRLDSDPPRQGTVDSGWHAAADTLR